MVGRVSGAMSLLAGVATLAIVMLISVDVLMRYFFNAPQIFVAELTSYLQVFVVFAGLAYTFLQRGHVRVDLVTSRLTPQVRGWLRVVTLTLGIMVLVVFIWVTSQSVVTAYRYGRASVVMQYPLWMPMSFIPSGLALMAAAMLATLVKQIRTMLGPVQHRDEI